MPTMQSGRNHSPAQPAFSASMSCVITRQALNQVPDANAAGQKPCPFPFHPRRALSPPVSIRVTPRVTNITLSRSYHRLKTRFLLRCGFLDIAEYPGALNGSLLEFRLAPCR
jgi:hypothetical protein